jgi:hypothetical protein
MSDEMKNKINTNNFKTLIEALEALPEGIRSNKVNMSSAHEPVRCFAGLISIVANDIPELREVFAPKRIYSFQRWGDALNEYLDINFRKWAQDNPEIWGNENGWYVFSSINAFGDIGGVLTYDDIIVFLRRVYERERWVVCKGNRIQKYK